MEVRKRVLACEIEPVLTYGCETMELVNKQNKSEASGMWCKEEC